MIRNLKSFDNESLMNKEKYKEYVEKFESEILRGISTLSILTIIKRYCPFGNPDQDEGIYGYQLLQDLNDETNNMLVIEEGKLYPLLKKLEKDEILTSERKTVNSRPRKYYKLSAFGYEVYNHLSGFFAKLMEAIGPLMDIHVGIEQEKFFFCPNCANKINLNEDSNFCVVCGYNISDRLEEKEE